MWYTLVSLFALQGSCAAVQLVVEFKTRRVHCSNESLNLTPHIYAVLAIDLSILWCFALNTNAYQPIRTIEWIDYRHIFVRLALSVKIKSSCVLWFFFLHSDNSHLRSYFFFWVVACKLAVKFTFEKWSASLHQIRVALFVVAFRLYVWKSDA